MTTTTPTTATEITFRKWLTQFKKDDSAIGDLARDVAEMLQVQPTTVL